MYYSCLSVFLQVLLLGSTWVRSINSETAQQVIEAALSSVKNFKSDFEQLKLKRDKNYLYNLFDAICKVEDEFFSMLDDEVFRPEECKVEVLIETLKDTPEENCITNLKDYISNVKNKEGRVGFEYCYLSLESNMEQLKEKLSAGQEWINVFSADAEQKISFCENVYKFHGNLTELKSCVEEAQVNQRKVPSNLDKSYEGLTPSTFVTGVADCLDKLVLVIKTSLNENYDQIQKCLNSSVSSLGKDISVILPSYKLELSANAQKFVNEALNNLRAKPSSTLQNAASIRVKVEEVFKRKSRNTETIVALLEQNTEVVRFQSALFNASETLGKLNTAKSCLSDTKSRTKDMLKSRANDIKACLEGIQETISAEDVTKLEKQVVEQQIGEAQVALVSCLASSGIVVQNNTVVCSALADSAFETYLLSIDQQLMQANQKADMISTQIDYCEKLVFSSILSNLSGNKFQFEMCLKNKVLIDFTLNYE